MKKIVSRPSRFEGSLEVPSDKSLTHRAVLFSALAEGISTIENPLPAEDCLSTVSCVEALGCKVEKEKNKWRVHGRGLWGFQAPSKPLNCGNSGTTMRLLSGVLAAQDFTTVLIGDDSLSKRPMRRVAEPLENMGARITLKDDKFAPMKIEGNPHLKPILWESPVASAQVKSCVLLAGIHARGTTTFVEPTLSRDHTERMLKSCGVQINREANRVSVEGPAKLKNQDWIIPGDISSAAFFMVGALLIPAAHLRLSNINLNPTRTGILDVLKMAQARYRIENLKEKSGEPVGDILVETISSLQSFSIDEALAPRLIDEIPILAVLATQAQGRTVMKGLKELRIKETDRLKAMAENLKKLGAKITEETDGLIIEGPTPLRGAEVESFDDHRIAMSMAIAGLISDGKTVISGSEAVAISYPSFWNDLVSVGGHVS